ncbi:prefoldin subunit [Candidatus Parvarchaeota archaeon]|uniref:Prefoldin subunit beta n=1 Tax=Candidatus Acidifodinimicrobium mancum TaxID=2898728 RepID=A0A8T3UYR5_9ARCH|nr:prefoldin subunit [Candidatus Acidifodinimicrobium mancum]MBE5728719.1 prefoldin subunit [Candidatus Acidifodinimicrobium mancum]MBE5730281.1 prefoldin subunit [Candidatus Acidifodinimicrobium mancum]
MNKEEEYETLRQQLQLNTAQKQNLQLQYNELKKTLEEVEKTPDSEELYELVGQILIKKDKKMILEGLKDKVDIIEFRLKSVDKALSSDTQKLQELQKELDKSE